MNKDEKEALDARHKEDAALQKKLAAKAQEDSDRYDKAVGAKTEDTSAGAGASEEKASTEKKS